MSVYAIGDLHLSLGADKSMDIFPGWDGYLARLETGWRKLVKPEDTIVLAGDISWAMKLENCVQDFSFIHSLPGRKIILKGNHDYWWSTVSKMERFIQENDFHSLNILHNNCYLADGIAICGTRSWLFDPGEEQDAKVINREAGRLKASLDAAEKLYPTAEKVVFLHYPPVYTGINAPEIIDVLQQNNVKRCFYGHLHGQSIRWAVQGTQKDIYYKLISADALGFVPLHIPTIT